MVKRLHINKKCICVHLDTPERQEQNTRTKGGAVESKVILLVSKGSKCFIRLSHLFLVYWIWFE